MFKPEPISAVHVSACFTWDIEQAWRLVEDWRAVLPGIPVTVGGPAWNDPGGDFVPGLYVRKGVSISSRGCPEKCPWCFVPKREGKLRLLPIAEGDLVQDNNVTAFPRAHFEALCSMLRKQPRAATFAGGLQAARLRDWHIEELRNLKIRELWLAADTDREVNIVRRAALRLGLSRKKLRCYVMIGYDGETIEKAKRRLENVWEAGCLPFAQLYRDETGGPEYSPAWRKLVKAWSRPAIMYMNHRKPGGGSPWLPA